MIVVVRVVVLVVVLLLMLPLMSTTVFMFVFVFVFVFVSCGWASCYARPPPAGTPHARTHMHARYARSHVRVCSCPC